MSDRDEQLVRTEQGHLAVETRFRVRYFETDAMGIVHHASYVTWFEGGRKAFPRALGYPYSRMEAEGSASLSRRSTRATTCPRGTTTRYASARR